MHCYHFLASFHSSKWYAVIHLVFELSVVVPELSEWLKLLQNLLHVNILRADRFWQNLQNICDVLVFNNSGMEIYFLPIYEAEKKKEHDNR